MKIAAIYTGAIMIQPFSSRLKEAFPGSEIMNLLDDSLVQACMRAGKMTESVQNRLFKLYAYAQEADADVIINTCSSVGEAVAPGRKVCHIPILRIDEPMCRKAVAQGRRIGVIATLASTMEPTCTLLQQMASERQKDIKLYRGLANGAYEAACAGNQEEHNRLICQTASTLAQDCDILVLAQGSMERMENELQRLTGRTVLSSPAIFVEWFKTLACVFRQGEGGKAPQSPLTACP